MIRYYQSRNPDDASIDPEKIAAFAVNTSHALCDREIPTLTDLVSADIRRFLRRELMEDPQGRIVRKFQTAPRKQGEAQQSWFIFDTPPEKMVLIQQMKRRSTVDDAKQAEAERERYNDNNAFGAQLPLVDWDINKDLAEAKESTDYPSEPPDDDEDDGDDAPVA